jgi:transposase
VTETSRRAPLRIAIICDNFSPHLTTRKDKRVGQLAAANNDEIAYTPTNSSWLNPVEAQFTALRYLALNGTDHTSREEQASMIRRMIRGGNRRTLAVAAAGRQTRLRKFTSPSCTR